MRLSLIACAVLGLCAFGAPATIKVSGKVVDSSSNAGINGAKVEIEGGTSAKDAFDRIVETDAEGSFGVEVPRADLIHIRATAAGYSPVGEFSRAIVTKPDSGPLTVTFAFARSGTISGKIVDWETGLPLPNVRVWARRTRYSRGRRELWGVWGDGSATRSDSEGAFVLKGLPPADYVLDLNEWSSDPDDPAKPRKGYPRSYWPGSGDEEGIAPVPLTSATALDVGNVRLRKRDLPALSVKVIGSSCVKGQVYEVELSEALSQWGVIVAKFQAPCGSTALLENVTPGDYLIRAEAPWQVEEVRERAVTQIQVWERDVEVDVPITPPIQVRGKVSLDLPADAPDPKPELPNGIDVQLWNRGSKFRLVSPISADDWRPVAADGSFTSFVYMPPGGEFVAHVGRLPKNFYVKAIKYNGIESPGAVFVMNPEAMLQEVEVVISDKASALSGTVRAEDGKTVLNATVLMTPWPADVVFSYPNDVQETEADSSGTFTFTRLRPGAYRLIAVPSSSRPKLEEPRKLMALFGAAESVDVTEASAVIKNVALVSRQ